MTHSAQAPTTGGRRRRWAGLLAVSLTVAALPAVAPPLASKDIRGVNASRVALAGYPTPDVATVFAAQAVPVATLFNPQVNPLLSQVANAIHPLALAAFLDPQQQGVIDDFFRGGIAGVLKKQATSRLTSPDQTQILDDFFQGGVFQSEAHRFPQLFNDPQQHQFISDFVTGGLVQVVRNRLIDATSDPDQRAAIIAFFPDEVTDYRGGPIAVVQRRLIAAAKGNPAVIALVNTIFENPVVVAVQHLLGGGPLVGTPLHELPPITPDAAVAPPHTASVVQKTATIAMSTRRATPAVAEAPVEPATPSIEAEPSKPSNPTAAAVAEPKNTKNTRDADVIESGNKVEPGSVTGATDPVGGPSSAAAPTATASAPTIADSTSTAGGTAGNDAGQG